MADYSIPRSKAALKVELQLMFVATIAVALLAFTLIRLFYRVALSTRWHTGFISLIVILILGYLAIFIRQKKWKDVSYKLAPHSIVVSQASGFLTTTQEIYLYESIISASMTQGFFGKKYDYGDIMLVIPKLGSDVRLKALSEPDKQLNMLKSHMKDKINRQNLVT